MSTRCKKILSLLLAFSLLFSLSVPAFAELDGKVRTRVEGVGLMEGYEDGSFGEEDELTRAQMCMIAARILQVETVGFGFSPFTDVADDHWAKDVIATLSQAGVVNGMGDGTFMPDKSVSYFEAAKILVSVLGYGDFAENMGGYPNGYLAQASKLGLLKGITASASAISRGEVAQMLYGALDVKPIGYNFMQNYPESIYKLEEILSDTKDLVQFRGILQETSKTSILAAAPTAKAGTVVIGGTVLLCDMPMEEYLGCEMIVYAYLDESVDKYRLKSFNVTNNSVIYESESEDVIWNGDEAVLYDETGDELEELKMSGSLITIYNGRKASVPAGEREIPYGSYRFVDSDDNGQIDILFMNEAQSFIIEKINVPNKTVYFKNRVTLNGRRALVLDEEDTEKSVILVNGDGEPISVEDIEEYSGVTVYVSSDWNYVKAIVTNETIEGMVTAKTVDGIRVDDEIYEIAVKPDGSATCNPSVGDQATYVLDAYGKIIDSIAVSQNDYQYAYIIKAKYGSGLDSSISLQTVSGYEPQKEVKTVGEDEVISYYFQNETVKVYDCANNMAVYLDGAKVKEDLSNLDITKLFRTMAAFRLNSEGKIKELHTYDVSMVPFVAHNFNAGAMTFGGDAEQSVNVARGYATDENTKFICIPDETERSATTADYYVQVKLTDEDVLCRVYGTVFFPDPSFGEDADSEPVDILLIKEDMNASSAPVPGSVEDICIVGEISTVIGTVHDDVGAMVYELKLLNGTTSQTLATASGGEAYDTAATLRKGDLIRYVKDGFGRIAGIKKICSIQGLGEDYTSNVNMSAGAESAMYGLIYDVVMDIYDKDENDYIDKFALTYEPDGSKPDRVVWQRLPKISTPPVYHYDRRSGWVKAGSLEDITASSYAGSEASKAFVLTASNDVCAVVIIEN